LFFRSINNQLCTINPRRFRRVVRQLHHVIKIPTGNVPSDVKDMHLAFGMGDRLELLDTVELALEWTVMVECGSVHDFDGAIKSGCASRQPDFAIRAAANEPQHFVIRNDWRRFGSTQVAHAGGIQLSCAQ